MSSVFHIKEHKVPGQHIREWPRATANSQEDILYLHVKQYTPIDNPNPQPGDVTVIAAHANGFPKELYEALWADLLVQARTRGFRIRSIWIADIAQEGHSGVLNEHVLGDDPCWHDHARDLLHMINLFRADMPRPLVGIGHSFGANILTHLSLMHPRLLTSLVLLDPVITNFTFDALGPGTIPTRASAARRDLWPSREEAAAAFRRSRFYSSWDPRVLDAWIAHGIRPTPTPLYPDPADAGKVTLTTTKHQECFVFFRPLWPHLLPGGIVSKEGAPDFDPARSDPVDPDGPFLFYRAEGGHVLSMLPHVRPSVLWVFGGDSDLSPPEQRRLKTGTCGIGPGGSGGVAEDRVAEVVVQGRGHLFPMEVPRECAEHAASWIAKELARWRDQERRYDEWANLPTRDKTTLSPQFLDLLRRQGEVVKANAAATAAAGKKGPSKL